MKGNREGEKPSEMKTDPCSSSSSSLFPRPRLAPFPLSQDLHTLHPGHTFEVVMKGIVHSGILRTG